MIKRLLSREFLVVAAACLLAVGGRASEATERAAAYARIHVEAIGGKARVDALKSMRATGYSVTAGRKVSFTLTAARPDKIRLETESGARLLIQGSDGVNPPWQLDTGAYPQRYQDMPDAAARLFLADAEFDDPLINAEKRGYTLTFAGGSDVDGRKLLRIVVAKNKVDAYTLLLDSESYLIVLRLEHRASGGRLVQVVTRYDDFRPVGGVLLPHEVTMIVDGKPTQQTKIDQITANPSLSAEVFSRPKAASEEKK